MKKPRVNLIEKTITWNGTKYPFREATANLMLQPTEMDIANAIKGDREKCAFAQCIMRTLDVGQAVVYRTCAYVERRDEYGNPIVERYQVPKSGIRYIDALDRGEEIIPRGFILEPHCVGHTLEARIARDHRTREHKRKSKSLKIRKIAKPKNLYISYIRCGSGSVQAIKK